MLKWRRRRDSPHRRKQNKRQERHRRRHPPFRVSLETSQTEPERPSGGPAEGEREVPMPLKLARHTEVFIAGRLERSSRGGHACFCFHSPGTFTRPHMWVLNIYPNTRSNVVWAGREEAVGSPRKRSWKKSRGRPGPGGESKEIKVVLRWMNVCASKPWRGAEERGLGTVTGPRWGIKGLMRWGEVQT